MTKSLKCPLIEIVNEGRRVELYSPTAMPEATTILWNPKLVLQLNCRGFAVARHMQPEPARYDRGPNIEATTFIQPEHPYYAHHPGRYVYIKDEDSGELFSAPYEPVRRQDCDFLFSAGNKDVRWTVICNDIQVELSVRIPPDDAIELWEVRVLNTSQTRRRLAIYPVFTVGYMSWMNQSADYCKDTGAILASCVTPYQEAEDYQKVQQFKDCTFLLHDTAPDAWDARLQAFEGEGGMHSPDAIQADSLGGNEAVYETPVAALQYQRSLAAGEQASIRLVFGPAHDRDEVRQYRDKYFRKGHFEQLAQFEAASAAQAAGTLQVDSPDEHFNAFANHWLARQVFYHGDTNRLTTDPQTRNYLQDHMGLAYIDAQKTRNSLLRTLSQQQPDGNLPDGVLLHESAELKYINQVPHTDHCVWLPICLEAYLNESGDFDLLNTPVEAGGEQQTVFQRTTRAVQWLVDNRDDRGLSLIGQGDWCDPMNMVGIEGRGVSGWLTLATVEACQTWAGIARQHGALEVADSLEQAGREFCQAAREHLWDGRWFARGITDNGRRFGVSNDNEGSLYLNPQAWAMMSGCCDPTERRQMIDAVEEILETPHGVTMLGPPYTAMQEDIGRVTQKTAGSAENGSVYNHAAAYYIWALYQTRESEKAFELLSQMIPGPSLEDYLQRGQLPVFIPNYYRGDFKNNPRTAGRSSQMMNTGTSAWIYRAIIEFLFGLRGTAEGLLIDPQLPNAWPVVKAKRFFRGAEFNVEYHRSTSHQQLSVSVDDRVLEDNLLRAIRSGETYHIKVFIPQGCQV